MHTTRKEGGMISGHTGALRLSEEEAFALLGLCLTSPNSLDLVSEQALRKLAEFCTEQNSNHKTEIIHLTPQQLRRSA